MNACLLQSNNDDNLNLMIGLIKIDKLWRPRIN